MALSVPIDLNEVSITPVFKFITIEDVPASEREQRQMMKTLEAVEVRFAGNRNYSPVFPVDAMWKRDGHKVITYMERWPDQYRDFISGNDQKASGTPLEMLKHYGISDSQLSLCRVLKIYSIEALHQLEGDNLKSLQMAQGPLKDMAKKYMADRTRGGDASSEIAELRAQIAAMQAAMQAPPTIPIPPADPTPDDVRAALFIEIEAMDDAAIKAFIKERSGQAPRGTPSRDFLLSAAKELVA